VARGRLGAWHLVGEGDAEGLQQRVEPRHVAAPRLPPRPHHTRALRRRRRVHCVRAAGGPRLRGLSGRASPERTASAASRTERDDARRIGRALPRRARHCVRDARCAQPCAVPRRAASRLRPASSRVARRAREARRHRAFLPRVTGWAHARGHRAWRLVIGRRAPCPLHQESRLCAHTREAQESRHTREARRRRPGDPAASRQSRPRAPCSGAAATAPDPRLRLIRDCA
jgi:hypothetical protein